MNSWLLAGLSNALIAGLLAVAVATLTHFIRNPRIAHGLWLLVFLKLVTPPVIHWPLVIENRWWGQIEMTSTAASRQALPAEGALKGVPPTSEQPTATARVANDMVDSHARNVPLQPKSLSFELVSDMLFVVWIAGSLAWCALLVVRVARFHSRVRAAEPAPEGWQQGTAQMAARLGLRRVPSLRITDGMVPPLLWAIGLQPVILLPRKLFETLDASGRQALVAHELAHYARRDHWIRWLEMLAIALYWWFPVVWWTHHRLQAAEEECCDADALALLGQEPRTYGQALLASIDFLAAHPSRVPLTASAMGIDLSTNHLQRRFEMILKGSVPRRSWLTRAAIVVATIALLPISVRIISAESETTDWARLSPFTEVRIHDAGKEQWVDVWFDNHLYKLISIDGLTTEQLLTAARSAFGDKWEKRVVEDLVEVMEAAGKRPAATVKLVLRDRETGQERVVDKAPMTAENRKRAVETFDRARTWASHGHTVAGLEPSAEDERHIRQLVKEFVDAAHKGDLNALAKTLAKGPKGQDRMMRYAEELKEIPDGVDMSQVDAVLRGPGNRALAVTDFFSFKNGSRKSMNCFVYECRRVDNRWVIEDIDCERVEGLIFEISRYIGQANANQPNTAR